MITDYPKPNWKEWGKVHWVTILEGVALSLNIDPRSINKAIQDFRELGKLLLQLPEFHDRLWVVERNLERLTPLSTEGESTHWRVPLTQFADLLHSFRWDLPSEIVALTTGTLPTGTNHGANSKPSLAAKARHAGTRERTLAVVIRIINNSIATDDAKKFVSEKDQKIVATDLADLVNDHREQYENEKEKILSHQEIVKLVRQIVNGDYFKKTTGE